MYLQKECRFEEHFLIPLYKSSLNNTRDVKITLVSEFFEVNEAVRLNIENNIDRGRFLYVIGDSLKTLDKLISIAPPEINMEVYYAPGGVNYRHLFAAATRYSETFVIHNSDIGVGDMSNVVDACSNFDDSALFGSRSDVYPEKDRLKKYCTYYMALGSFDAVVTNRKHFDCGTLNRFKLPLDYWGTENNMAYSVPKETKAHLCPHWVFRHHHNSKNRTRPSRPRISNGDNTWHNTYKNDEVLASVCDFDKLPVIPDQVLPVVRA
mmetsp:Transcript_19571/g.27682  ORF Transcript_19571/g.27682 Transcript_19571/m.27682 type:complete len:265 (+) Transcript_19571:223-1017(+)